MIEIRYVLRYFALNYPYKDELSKTRLTKMVYLADWFSAQKNETQLTNIDWYFDHYGPYVSDVYDEARRDKKLTIKEDVSMYGTPKEIIAVKSGKEDKLKLGKLNKKDIKVLDEVIKRTKHFHWSEFIDFVYATYPIKSQSRYQYLDLVDLAKDEKSTKTTTSLLW